ncbi:BLUF domain-containing protein [uncultured Vibrio sp.]|uniref:BLUF domain-containing protein n=1 Tax=uncultured Vibrio sp. TaxID=114054 RepID=UPI0009110A1A|nr:BLUF domain-containing protein [uncultured Vibrio sp.]OIQ26511.1 MAG: blue light sensor protein [Vibrio sp. MedPE-SWchi]
MFLTRLIYASTITEALADAPVDSILESARSNNELNDVTGILYFNRKYFLQCLEGSRTAVNKTYQTILQDNRHSDIVILGYEEISEREFSDWKMGYIPSSSASKPLNIKFSGSSDFVPYQMSGESAYKMMLELKGSLPTI